MEPKKQRGADGWKTVDPTPSPTHDHFADAIVADALYLNTPFFKTVLNCRMDAVIRLKDEKRLIFQDAKGMFQQNLGKKDSFCGDKRTIDAWEISLL